MLQPDPCRREFLELSVGGRLALAMGSCSPSLGQLSTWR
jgi:hypothetical protein